MKKLEKTKMILGYILIGFSIIGIISALLFQFGGAELFFFFDEFYHFKGGGTSNLPIFYGLCAIAGSILLATVKKELKENK